jgi:hypothetical protein
MGLSQARERHALYDAARSGGCPVCARARAAGDRTAAELSGEFLNDPARAQLVASWGFCRDHAIACAAEVGAPLAIAILHEDLCERVARALTDGHAPTPELDCPSCLAIAESERLDTPVARAAGLVICPNHPRSGTKRELPRGEAIAGALPIGSLAEAIRTDGSEGPRQATAYETIAARLAGVVRHHDYRFFDERFEDWSVCWEALALFSGTDPTKRPTR